MRYLFLGLIKLYRYFISPLLGQNCRFHPSCSNFAMEAVESLPWWKYPFIILWRIARCQPFSSGGTDPVSKYK